MTEPSGKLSNPPLPASYHPLDQSVATWTPPASYSNQPFDLSKIWNVVKRRGWIIVLSVAVATVSSVVVAMKSPRVYSASATLLISSNETVALPIPGSVPATSLATDLTLISTATVMDYASKILKDQGITIPSEALAGQVSAASVTGTDLVTVSATWGDPGTCAAIADAAAEGFGQYRLVMARKHDETTLQFISQEMADVQQKLDKSEQQLIAFQNRTGVDATRMAVTGGGTGVDTGVSNIPDDTKVVQSSLSDALQQRDILQAHLDKVRAQLAAWNQKLLSQGAGAIQGPSAIPALEQQLADKQAQLAQARRQFTPAGVEAWYPGLTNQVADLQRQLDAQVASMVKGNNKVDLGSYQAMNEDLNKTQNDLDAQDLKVADLQKRLADTASHPAAKPETMLELSRLLRDREILTGVYQSLLDKQKTVEISISAAQTNVSVLTHASVPTVPIKPQRRQRIMLGILVGIILGSALAYIIEYLDNSIRTWSDVTDTVGLPVLGTVPITDTHPSIVWQGGHRSVSAEAFRMLRSNVSFVSVDEPVRTMLITSAGPGEGKSSIIVNLAAAMAQDEKRVVVIDADMRRPSIHRILACDRHIGLAEVLSGSNSVEEALKSTEMPNVWTIPVDKIPPNPAELLSGQRMRDMLGRLKDMFDVILIDSPPCLMVTDPVVISSIVDATIQVVAAGRTSRATAIRARDVLLAARGRVVGVVLNRFDSKDEGSNYDYTYYYYYYYTSGEDHQPKSALQKLFRTKKP